MENQDENQTNPTEGTEPTLVDGATPTPTEAEAPPAPAVTSELPFVGGVSIRKGTDGTYLVVPDEVEVESKGAATLAEAADLARDYLNTIEE